MKKFMLVFLPLIALIIAILLYRGNNYYQDTQLTANTSTFELTANKPQILQRLSKAIQIKTISYDDPNKLDPAAFTKFHQLLEDSYPLVHQHANKTVINQHSLLYLIKGSDPQLKPALLMAHMDVVPVDQNTLSQWTHPPYSGLIKDGVIWGRGALDNKSGVMGIMEALEQQLAAGKQFKRSIYLAFGHDEESGGLHGAAKTAEYLKQQNVELEFVLDEGGAVTQGLMQGVDKPVALIGIAEKGYANLHLTVNAAGGHSSQPPKQTAVGILSQAIVNLQNNPFDGDLTFTKMTFDAIGHAATFGSRLAMANLWLLEPLVLNQLMNNPKMAASLHTTMAPTMMQGSSKSNILPTQASAVINLRLFPNHDINEIKQHIEQVIDDQRVKIELKVLAKASKISPIDTPTYQMIAQSIRDIDNQVIVAPYVVQGGTDSKHFYALTDKVYRYLMIRVNADTFKRFHGIDEQIAAKEYFEAIQFYSQVFDWIE